MFIFNPTLYSLILMQCAEYNRELNKVYAPLGKDKVNLVQRVLAALTGGRHPRKQAAQVATAAQAAQAA